MRYFGVSKRVKVSDKVEPRDFDRNKMFKEVTPLVNKGRYIIRFTDYETECSLPLTIENTIGCEIKDWIISYQHVSYFIEATEKQIELVKILKGFKNIKEVK